MARIQRLISSRVGKIIANEKLFEKMLTLVGAAPAASLAHVVAVLLRHAYKPKNKALAQKHEARSLSFLPFLLLSLSPEALRGLVQGHGHPGSRGSLRWRRCRV